MRLTRKTNDDREPMGIVIADGGHGDHTPRLSAFVWGPVPDDLLADLAALDEAPALLAGAC